MGNYELNSEMYYPTIRKPRNLKLLRIENAGSVIEDNGSHTW
jgi:hypothetical protein